jgi:rod shape determining protein RodA
MKSFLTHFKKMDWLLIISASILSCVGFLVIYSSSLADQDFLNLKKQIIFFAVGVFLMMAMSFFDWRNFRNNSYLILALYFLGILSLSLLLFFGPEVRGTKTWYKVGPVSVDPVEFMKIILIILLAKYFSTRHIEMYRIQHIFLSGLYVLIPVVLVFMQPNLGSVLILLSIWIGALIISGIKIRHFLLLVFLFVFIFAISWGTVLKDYQKQRILSFITPQSSEALTIGWNQTQSKIAIGSGGLLGQGIGKGSQTQYGFLPEAHTDFAFALIAEETGLLGAAVVLFLFCLLIWRIMLIAISTRSNFPRLFASGVVVVIISQIFIHLGMNMGILPIIGIPLPLVSYGGSGLIAIFMAFGVLQSIKISE